MPLFRVAQEVAMAHRKRNGKIGWRSKKANHGSLPTRGKEKRWGKKSKSKK
jgi:hypothetical protein